MQTSSLNSRITERISWVVGRIIADTRPIQSLSLRRPRTNLLLRPKEKTELDSQQNDKT